MLRSQKQIGLVALLSLFSLSIYAEAFDGFYFGGGIGGSQSAFDVNQSLEIKPFSGGRNIYDIVQNNKEKLTDGSFLGDLNLGFGHVFSQRWYLGIEGDAVFQDLQTDAAPLTQERNSNLSFSQKTTVELTNQFSLAVVPGIVFKKNTLFYGKIGAAWGNFDVKSSTNYSQLVDAPITLSSNNSFSDSSYENGLLLGVGMEQFVTKNLSIKLEYNHINYDTIHDNTPTASPINSNEPIPITGSMTDSAGVSASTNSVMLGIAYHLA